MHDTEVVIASALEDDDSAITETTHLICSDSDSSNRSRELSKRQKGLLSVCILSAFLIEFGHVVMVAPTSVILEASICETASHERRTSPDTSKCKTIDVQAKLTAAREWSLMISVLPGLLTSIPYGMLSTRIGCQNMLSLALVGMTAALATRVFFCMLNQARWKTLS